MPYIKWFNKTVKQVPKQTTPLQRYVNTSIFGLLVFALLFWYIQFLEIPNPTNKAIANTAVVLMGFSMWLSSLCYFWDFVDTKIVYRKHLGLIGYAFGLAHVVLSFSGLQKLFSNAGWASGVPIAPLSGALALGIFTIMALISNRFSAITLGGITWRYILRTGYIALLLTWVHVVALKSKYWLAWAQEGFQTLPSASFLISLFILVVVVMRLGLEISLRRKKV